MMNVQTLIRRDDAREELGALAERLNRSFATLGPAERLRALRRELPGRLVFTTGFGLEGQIIFHLISTNNLDSGTVTLDTGRLFPESYALWAQTEERYGRRIEAIYPQARELQQLIARQGINGFYKSLEARLSCCHVRKVEPLGRALTGAQAWITGLRADQSRQRRSARFAEFDAHRVLIKVNPLLDWTREQALDFARAHEVPVNPLHAAGFASIGCAPCTRAIVPGEPERAGRWWWEADGKTECGLHLKQPSAA
jgi:phosphoadenosine phosphosulfate reductase